MERDDYLKALVAGILAALAALAVALINNGDITGGELGVIIAAFVAGTGLTKAAPDAETLQTMRETRRLRSMRRASSNRE